MCSVAWFIQKLAMKYHSKALKSNSMLPTLHLYIQCLWFSRITSDLHWMTCSVGNSFTSCQFCFLRKEDKIHIRLPSYDPIISFHYPVYFFNLNQPTCFHSITNIPFDYISSIAYILLLPHLLYFLFCGINIQCFCDKQLLCPVQLLSWYISQCRLYFCFPGSIPPSVTCRLNFIIWYINCFTFILSPFFQKIKN